LAKDIEMQHPQQWSKPLVKEPNVLYCPETATANLNSLSSAFSKASFTLQNNQFEDDWDDIIDPDMGIVMHQPHQVPMNPPVNVPRKGSSSWSFCCCCCQIPCQKDIELGSCSWSFCCCCHCSQHQQDNEACRCLVIGILPLWMGITAIVVGALVFSNEKQAIMVAVPYHTTSVGNKRLTLTVNATNTTTSASNHTLFTWNPTKQENSATASPTMASPMSSVASENSTVTLPRVRVEDPFGSNDS
jgi:hypothetical protein